MDAESRRVAQAALACLDLTSLNDADTEADVDRLCARAAGRHGTVAAVCVWPRFVARAKARLPAAVRVAAVANFPDGSSDTARAVADTRAIVAAGGDEVDVVLPWRDLAAAPALLAAVRAACPGLTLKVIVESGALGDPSLVDRAARVALAAGADFVKTSTGRTPVGATPEAARVLLAAIGAGPQGLKVSGGVRSVADAAAYLALAEARWGDEGRSPRRFRIGASGLLAAIEAVLDGGTAAPAATGY